MDYKVLTKICRLYIDEVFYDKIKISTNFPYPLKPTPEMLEKNRVEIITLFVYRVIANEIEKYRQSLNTPKNIALALYRVIDTQLDTIKAEEIKAIKVEATNILKKEILSIQKIRILKKEKNEEEINDELKEFVVNLQEAGILNSVDKKKYYKSVGEKTTYLSNTERRKLYRREANTVGKGLYLQSLEVEAIAGGITAIAGLAGSGKTDLAVDIAKELVMKQQEVLFYSLELTGDQFLTSRLEPNFFETDDGTFPIYSKKQLDWYSLNNDPDLYKTNIDLSFEEKEELLDKVNLFDLENTGSKITFEEQIKNSTAKFVFVDYLKYMSSLYNNFSSRSTYEQLDGFMRKLKELAVKYKKHIFVLTTMNKMSDDGGFLNQDMISGSTDCKHEPENIIIVSAFEGSNRFRVARDGGLEEIFEYSRKTKDGEYEEVKELKNFDIGSNFSYKRITFVKNRNGRKIDFVIEYDNKTKTNINSRKMYSPFYLRRRLKNEQKNS